MKKLANFCYSRRRLVVLAWAAILVVLLGLSAAFAGEYKTEFKLPGSESQEALDLLQGRRASASAPVSRARSCSGRTRASTTRPCGRRWRRSLATSRAASRTFRSPARTPRRTPSRYRSDGKVAYAEINFSDRSNEAVHRRRRRDQGRCTSRREAAPARAADRAGRRPVCVAAGVLQRAHRRHGGGDHPAASSSAPSWRWACRLSLRCSASAAARR